MGLFETMDNKLTGGLFGKLMGAKNIMLGTNPYDFNVNDLPTPSPQEFIRNPDTVMKIGSVLKNMHIGDDFKKSFEERVQAAEEFKSKSEAIFRNLTSHQKSYNNKLNELKGKRNEILDFYSKNKDKIDKMKFMGITGSESKQENVEKKEIRKNMIENAGKKIKDAQTAAETSLNEAHNKAEEQRGNLIEELGTKIKDLNTQLEVLKKKEKKYLEELKKFFNISDKDRKDDDLWVKIQNKFKDSYRKNWNYVKGSEFKDKEKLSKAKEHYNWIEKNYKEIEKLNNEIKKLKETKKKKDGSYPSAEILEKYCKGEYKKYLPDIQFLRYYNVEDKCYTLKGEYKNYQDDYNLIRGKYTGKYKYLETYDSINKKGKEYKSIKKDIDPYIYNFKSYNSIMKDLKDKIEAFTSSYTTLSQEYKEICDQLNNLKSESEKLFGGCCSGLEQKERNEIKKIKVQGLKFSNSSKQISGQVAAAYLAHIANALTNNDCYLTKTALKFDKMERINQNLKNLDLNLKKKKDTSIFSKVFSKIKSLI